MKRNNDSRMTLGEHLEELRRSLLRAAVGVLVGMAACLAFGKHIMMVMCWPAAVAMSASGLPIRLRTLAPAESFMTYLKICLIWGVIVSAPYGLLQIWKFISAGLFAHEKKYVRRYVPFSVGLFVVGVGFFFLVIASICLIFFLGFGQSKFPTPTWRSPILPAATQPTEQAADGADPAPSPLRLPVLQADPSDPAEGQAWIGATDGRIRFVLDGKVHAVDVAPGSFVSAEITLGYYMTFVSWLSLVFGLAFQVPIVVLVLTKTQLVPLARMRTMRKYVVLVLLTVAALLTPPDVVSQVALAVPMYLLFELGLLMARRGGQSAAARTG